MSYDKIINAVHPQIIETINTIRDAGKIEILKDWLNTVSKEITRRGPHDCYMLQCEKAYLELVIGK